MKKLFMISINATALLMVPMAACADNGISDALVQQCTMEAKRSDLVWHKANLTTYTPYPEEGSPECITYSGCAYEGEFEFINGKKSKDWILNHNIASMHENEAWEYRNRTLCLRQGTHSIAVKVYDMCSDSDCDGCCTENSKETGHLIDLEINTADRFMAYDGVIDWRCLDCDE